jgi:hypothetical protein
MCCIRMASGIRTRLFPKLHRFFGAKGAPKDDKMWE